MPRPAPKPILEPYFTPIYVMTGISVALMIIGAVLPRGPDAGLIRTSVLLTVFCMWIFWLIVYAGQMNPLVGPKVDNTTAAWLSKSWGINAKEVQAQNASKI